ncbi:uncharacterized protein NEMAJ01_1376 [Nematocida major]|uniref:uncharacterized protein n=1 Tax=Nematocida major TaxID=1912982 RepID=UPI0020086A51|nr:uncharacterized protein NEMAJ01_1376 [Nematocida major]KAH9386480.1 hypothetical protein NEMAJ01_1376 [Nematocida major]
MLDETEKNDRMSALIGQVIQLEDEVQRVREENRVLKENIVNSNRNLSQEIVCAVVARIDALRQELHASKKPELDGRVQEAVHVLHAVTEGLKSIAVQLEQEIRGLLESSYSQYKEIQEMSQKLELYAEITRKLLVIKDEYMKTRRMG